MPMFKKGKQYSAIVTLTVTFVADEDYDDEDDVNDLVETEVSEGRYDIDRVDFEDSDNDEDDEEEEHLEKCEAAQELWDELRAGKEGQTLDNGKPAYPDLTSKQEQFIADALDCGLEVRTYSGRGMYGRYCPGVVVDHLGDVGAFTRVKYSHDSMGMSYIVYVS